MRFLLQNNRSEFRNRYQSGLASQIWVPLNAGRYIGADNQSSVFKNRPDTDSIKLTDWITNQITLENITFTGDLDFDGNIQTTGDLTFTEVVASPSTSATYTIKSKTVVHTTTAAATNTIATQIPIGAKILGASVIVTTDLVFAGGGADAELTWATSGQVVGTALASQNDKSSAFFDENVDSAIVTGSAEDMTLTPDAGTLDAAGVLVVTVWYAELTDPTDVA